MNVKTVFGSNLKHYRKEKNLSQERLSEKVDISVKHLSEIERGIVFASAGLLEKLAESLDIPVFAFFLTGNSVYYDNIMLERIENIIINNIGQTIQEIKQGHFQ
jgi:transcriptional regulator with XRE-family HTH domain